MYLISQQRPELVGQRSWKRWTAYSPRVPIQNSLIRQERRASIMRTFVLRRRASSKTKYVIESTKAASVTIRLSRSDFDIEIPPDDGEIAPEFAGWMDDAELAQLIADRMLNAAVGVKRRVILLTCQQVFRNFFSKLSCVPSLTTIGGGAVMMRVSLVWICVVGIVVFAATATQYDKCEHCGITGTGQV